MSEKKYNVAVKDFIFPFYRTVLGSWTKLNEDTCFEDYWLLMTGPIFI